MIYDVLDMGTHKVRITLQYEDFIGHIITEIGGNCHGRDIIGSFDFECEEEFDNDFTSNDCSLQYNDDLDVFSAVLRNSTGTELILEDKDAEEMNNLIVGIEIIDFIPE